ncbi:MAG: GNAT family protein [Anaerolineae bacterium]|jgi:RimJ/RimL family protein N-acetyltransferase
MIQGTKVRLRALAKDDLHCFVRWINDPETRRFMNVRYPLSMTEEEGWWENFIHNRSNHIFAIETKDGAYIGNIGLHAIVPEDRKAEMGVLIGDKRYWGQGYGTDAIRSLVMWAFDYLNLNRISLRVFAYNKRAIRAYEKAGFQREGAMRQARYTDGQHHDEIIMGVLRDEFPGFRGDGDL